jgi:DNA-binding XRE family transcriptional regulator
MSVTVVFNEKQIAQVEALAAYLTQEQIADYFGISRKTWYNLCERQPEILTHYKKGKANTVGDIARSLITKAREGDNTAMIFYLKTQAHWRETSIIEMVEKEADKTLEDFYKDDEVKPES